MPLGAFCTSFAVAVEAKGATYGGSCRHFHVSILAIRLGAAISSIVQTGWGALGGGVMGEIAVIAVGAAAQQKVFADGNLVGVVGIPALGAFRAGAYKHVRSFRWAYRTPIRVTWSTASVEEYRVTHHRKLFARHIDFLHGARLPGYAVSQRSHLTAREDIPLGLDNAMPIQVAVLASVKLDTANHGHPGGCLCRVSIACARISDFSVSS